MGLGNRTGHRHETVAAAKVSARSEDYWDFQPGQRVMTVDGFPGKVTAVNDGPVMGVESYLVTLDNEMGHGEYSPTQLRPASETTASVHTAAEDYPELREILAERPDIAINTVLGSRTAADRGGAATNTVASNPYGIETFPGQEPNDGADSGVDEHGHLTWGGHAPSCGDTDEYSMFGQNDAAEKTASSTDPLSTSHCTSYRDNPTFCNWHKTDHLEPDGEPRRDIDGHGNQMSSHTVDIPQCDLCNGFHDSLDHYNQTETADHFQEPDPDDKDWVHTDWSDEPGPHREAASKWIDPNEKCPNPNPHDPNECGYHHLELGDPNRCPFRSPHDPGECGYSHPEINLLSKKKHHHEHPLVPHPEYFNRGIYGGWGWPGCVACADNDGPDGDGDADDAGGGDAGGSTTASKEPQDPWNIITTAAADPDFRFHITAAWADVRNKAKRIRSEGGVHITAASNGLIHAEVRGDTNVYEAGLQRLPGASAIQAWSCGCKWGAYHWGAADDLSRFAGRMCSHALALQYEAQSRGMFGRTVNPDDSKPSWVPRKVVVKYDIADGRNVSAPATTSPRDFGFAASLKAGDPLLLVDTPLTDLMVHAMRTGEHFDEADLAFRTIGVNIRRVPVGDHMDALQAWASVNSPWGEPDPPQAPHIPGPTKPRNTGDNPASSGWATSGDPDSWSEQGPSGLDHMTSALDDSFEPEVSHTADLHAAPEAALPTTDGADGDDNLYGGGDIGSTDDLEPDDSSFVSTGSLDEFVAQFQATAGAKAIQNSGPAASDGMDLAAAASMYLATGEAPKPGMTATALKAFSPAEQHQIISEGENVQAANLDRLDIAGTHYVALEAALQEAEERDDDGWLA